MKNIFIQHSHSTLGAWLVEKAAAPIGLCRHWDELISFLKDSIALVSQYMKENKPIIPPDKTIVLWGAGDYGRQLRRDLRRVQTEIDYFCDSAIKPGSLVEGVEVITPERLASVEGAMVFVAVHNAEAINDIADRLAAARVEYEIADHCPALLRFWEAGRVLETSEAFQGALPRIEKVFRLLDDDKSRVVYLNVLKARFLPINWAYIFPMISEGAQYWALPEFLDMEPDAVFVDVGAFTGDSVEFFLQNNAAKGVRIFSFEPVPEIFEILTRNVQRLEKIFRLPPGTVKCLSTPLGSREPARNGSKKTSFPPARYCPLNGDGLLRANQYLTEPNFTLNGEAVDLNLPMLSVPGTSEVRQLDDFFKDGPVDLIKMDTEGCEMEILRGGAETIKRSRPKLAISIYHKNQDLFELPLYIHSLVPEYRMAVRHHCSADMSETVLYCWPGK